MTKRLTRVLPSMRRVAELRAPLRSSPHHNDTHSLRRSHCVQHCQALEGFIGQTCLQNAWPEAVYEAFYLETEFIPDLCCHAPSSCHIPLAGPFATISRLNETHGCARDWGLSPPWWRSGHWVRSTGQVLNDCPVSEAPAWLEAVLCLVFL